MARIDNKLWALLGFVVTGDAGPYTFYTSKRRKIVGFPRMPALNPPSDLQTYFRGRIQQAARMWNAKTKDEKDRWKALAKGCCNKQTGYIVWCYYFLTGDKDSIQTLERCTNIDVGV